MKSYGRNYDRENRILIMENMGVMMRMYARTGKGNYLATAKELGVKAKQLSERIKNYDYEKENEDYEIVGEMDRCAKRTWDELRGTV